MAAATVSFTEYLGKHWDHLVGLTLEHAQIVGIAMAIATTIGLSLACLSYRRPAVASWLLAGFGIIFTIPSFALLALLIPPFGLGAKPTTIALVAYALVPILRNSIAGLQGVDPAIVDAARGMGMSRRRCLLRVELPLAWPVILAGVRVAALMLVGIAAIAAAVNGPGLGQDIFAGLARIGSPTALHLVLGGTLGVIVIALALDGLLLAFAKLTTSRGLR